MASVFLKKNRNTDWLSVLLQIQYDWSTTDVIAKGISLVVAFSRLKESLEDWLENPTCESHGKSMRFDGTMATERRGGGMRD